MKKGFLIIAVVMAICFMFVLAACSGGGTTFEGSVSESAFASVDETVKGFLTNELEGTYTQADYVKYTKGDELTAAEIAALPVANIGKVAYAEKGKVTYKDTTKGSDSEAVEKEHEVYILKMADKEEYRYYVPGASNGEAVTKSEYEKVFGINNMTLEVKMDEIAETSESEEKHVAHVTGILMVTENETWMEMEETVDGEKTKMRLYSKIDGGKIFAYLDYGDGWTDASSEFDSMIDIDDYKVSYTPPYDLMERTSNGYKVSADKLFAYQQDISNRIVGYQYLSFKDVSGECFYNVKDGYISSYKATLKATLETNESDGYVFSEKIDLNYQGEYKNIGKTNISIPQDLKEFMNAN